MRKVLLRMIESEKYELIKNYIGHEGNKIRLSVKLNLSIRQLNRLIIKYKRETRKRLFMAIDSMHRPIISLKTSPLK